MSQRVAKTRRELMRKFVPASPLVRHLGIELVELVADRAELRLPFDERLATTAEIVHGGAIASLIDTAGMAAAWSDDVEPKALSGATVSMHVDYVSPAVGTSLRATARVIRRGQQLCFTEIEVSAEPDGSTVARGSVVQRFGTG